MCGPFRNGMPGQNDPLLRGDAGLLPRGFASLSQYCLPICQANSPIPAGICRSPLKGREAVEPDPLEGAVHPYP